MTSPVPFFVGGASAASVAGVLNYGLIWEFDATTLSMTPTFGAGTPTVTRAGNTATRFNSSGLLEVINANLPRFTYGLESTTFQGLLVEEARTNVVLQNRDLTDAAWAVSNVTAAKDQTGIDGSANSASSITATAIDGTILQSITLASSARYQTAYVKRLVGTGTVNMTMDNGTTWTPITVTAAWTRVSIPSQTVTDPIVGFQIATSGDSIAVDVVQNENGAFITSAIPTTTAAVARAADVITLATSSITGFSATTLTMYTEMYGAGQTGAAGRAMEIHDGSANERILIQRGGGGNPNAVVTDGAVSQASLGAGTWNQGQLGRFALAVAANDFAASFNGGSVVTDLSGTLPTVTTVNIGTNSAAVSAANAPILKLRLYNVRKSNAQLQAMTA